MQNDIKYIIALQKQMMHRSHSIMPKKNPKVCHTHVLAMLYGHICFGVCKMSVCQVTIFIFLARRELGITFLKCKTGFVCPKIVLCNENCEGHYFRYVKRTFYFEGVTPYGTFPWCPFRGIFTCILVLQVRQTSVQMRMGMRLQQNEYQLEILKAATKAPTNIRKIVPGPITVPAINIACVRKGEMQRKHKNIPNTKHF